MLKQHSKIFRVNLQDSIDFSSLEKQLSRLYKNEVKKIISSIQKYCEKGKSAGINQTIGRRFGYFWEEMVKNVFEEKIQTFDRKGLEIDISTLTIETVVDIIQKNTKLQHFQIKNIKQKIADNLQEILDFGVLEIADCTYTNTSEKKVGLEIKWRIRWNDSKTVKSHVLAALRLKSKGHKPIMLIRC